VRKIRVIIIDDEDVILNSFKRWLSKTSYEVLTYNNPTVCPLCNKNTKKCMKEYPCTDIIFADIKMPHMSGIEFLEYQSQIGCKLDIKNKTIISGYIDDDSREAIERLGCSFFKKPIDLSLMSDWLHECEKRIDLSLPLDAF
jgi:response regulator RpfG family c-di-GMP phosphodiesterase